MEEEASRVLSEGRRYTASIKDETRLIGAYDDVRREAGHVVNTALCAMASRRLNQCDIITRDEGVAKVGASLRWMHRFAKRVKKDALRLAREQELSMNTNKRVTRASSRKK